MHSHTYIPLFFLANKEIDLGANLCDQVLVVSVLLCCASETYRVVVGPVLTEWALEAGLGIADKVLKEETSPGMALFFQPVLAWLSVGFLGYCGSRYNCCPELRFARVQQFRPLPQAFPPCLCPAPWDNSTALRFPMSVRARVYMWITCASPAPPGFPFTA